MGQAEVAEAAKAADAAETTKAPAVSPAVTWGVIDTPEDSSCDDDEAGRAPDAEPSGAVQPKQEPFADTPPSHNDSQPALPGVPSPPWTESRGGTERAPVAEAAEEAEEAEEAEAAAAAEEEAMVRRLLALRQYIEMRSEMRRMHAPKVRVNPYS